VQAFPLLLPAQFAGFLFEALSGAEVFAVPQYAGAFSLHAFEVPAVEQSPPEPVLQSVLA
jgi:hypothetical protein